MDKGLIFNQNIVTDLKFIGNKALIHTLLINIINNAIKYNVQGGTIDIYGDYENESYKIKVSDSGIGMTKELLEDAFDRFKRGNDEEQGFGLGLAIVQSIAKFHKIEIGIESKIDSGTIITLIFPK